MSSLTTEEFDFTMICHGLQYASHIPSFPGATGLKELRFTAASTENGHHFVDKTVLVYMKDTEK